MDVTASIGVAECAGADTVASLIKRADEAMYRAKGAGSNRVCGDGIAAACGPVPETEAEAGRTH